MAEFEVYKSTSKDGGFRWRMRANNGEIIASGRKYTTKAACKKGSMVSMMCLLVDP